VKDTSLVYVRRTVRTQAAPSVAVCQTYNPPPINSRTPEQLKL